MKIQIAGKLFWQDHDYYLIDPHPLWDEREPWMRDSEEKFRVCQENGRVFDIIVSRPFLISRLDMGKEVEIKALQLEEDMENSYKELFENLSVMN